MATAKNTGLENEVKTALMAAVPDSDQRAELGQALSELCGSRKPGCDLATRANDMLHRIARAYNLKRGMDAGTTKRLPGTRKAHVVESIGNRIKEGHTPREALAAEIEGIGAPVEGLNDGATRRGASQFSDADVFG